MSSLHDEDKNLTSEERMEDALIHREWLKLHSTGNDTRCDYCDAPNCHFSDGVPICIKCIGDISGTMAERDRVDTDLKIHINHRAAADPLV